MLDAQTVAMVMPILILVTTRKIMSLLACVAQEAALLNLPRLEAQR